MSAQTPALLAQLPQPLFESGGQIQFGPCYGLTGSRKRKRFEIAAAVDGETLNIYDVQASRLVSSYAVPPTSSFTCPPCSIRMRHASGSRTARFTVCATQRPELQIECFKETAEHSKTSGFSTYHHVVEDQSPAVHLDFVPVVANRGEPESIPDIIVVHQDGTIKKFSGDLQKMRWVSGSVSKPEDRALPPHIVFARLLSYVDASTGLLRKRDDLLKESASSGSSFLLLVYRDGDHQESGLRVGVFDVPMTVRTGFTSSNSGQRLRMFVSNPIPDSARWNLAANLQLDYHAPSGRLCISSRNELIYYDLSTYTPEISSKLVLDDSHTSLFPLTATLTAGASRSAVQIYDTSYQSIKRHFELNSKSRRRGPEDSARKSIRFISYFEKASTLVALRGRNILTFDLTTERAKKRKASHAASLLIDSLGCKTYASSRITAQAQAELGPGFSKALFVPNSLEEAGWEAQQKKLDDLVQRNLVEDFERVMVDEFHDALAEKKGGMIRSPLKLPNDKQFVRNDKIRYLLSKIFQASASSAAGGEGERGANVVVTFYPPRLLQWLAQRGHLGTSEIERALSRELSQLQLKLGAVAGSLIEQDPSLSLLADYLEGANISGLDEAVTVIKILIEDAVALAQRGSPTERLLLEDRPKMAADGSTALGREVSASRSQSGMAAGGWSRECLTALKRTLETLASSSHFKMTSAIRTHLDIEQTLALIQFLRQQLFRSGHTSSFPSFPVESEDAVLSLEITVSVLASCIDALGPLGFLGSTSEEGLWQGLVPDLKGEISLALACIEEATYLKGVLQEMVRYGNAASGSQVLPTSSSLQHSGKPHTGAGTIVSMYAEQVGEQDPDLRKQSSLLPLSLNVENSVSRTKKRTGGGEVMERSGRELQYLKHRNIGRYSFERLML